METAVRIRVVVGADHVVRLPDEIPSGEADIIVLFRPSDAVVDRAQRIEARRQMFGRLRGQATIADDFDAPLPEEILRDFEGRDGP